MFFILFIIATLLYQNAVYTYQKNNNFYCPLTVSLLEKNFYSVIDLCKKRKILISYLRNGTGGVRAHVFALARLLQKIGLEPVLLAHESALPIIEKATSLNLKVETCNEKNLDSASFLVGLCRKHSIGLVNTNISYEIPAFLKIKSFCDIKVIHTVHGTSSIEQTIPHFPHLDGIINVNEQDLKIIKKHRKDSSAPVFFINPVFDESTFYLYKPEVSKFDFFKSLGLFPADKKIISVVSNFYGEGKNQEVIIKALHILKHEYGVENIFVVLAGIAPSRKGVVYQERCRSMIQALDLNNQVCIPGFVHDIKTLYYYSDVAMNTSFSEGLPIAILEAAAQGKTIIATYGTGTTTFVKEHKTGLLFDPADPYDCAAQIYYLLNNKNKAAEIGSNAQKSLLSEYSLHRTATKLLEAYSQVLKIKNRSLFYQPAFYRKYLLNHTSG